MNARLEGKTYASPPPLLMGIYGHVLTASAYAMQYTCDASDVAKGLGSVTLATCSRWASNGQGGGVGA